MDTRVFIVGAGPIGLEVACELKRRGIEEYVHVDKGQIASTIAWYPQQTTFFSSNDRIAIGGIPIQTVGERKSTKEEYLAYLRTVARAHDLAVRTYEEVTELAAVGDRFEIRTRSREGQHEYRADSVVLATGDMASPRLLGIPGESLPHVSHYFEDPHRYFRQRLLVVGGKNSAVEAALRCWHAGADVTLSYRRAEFDESSVKYWLLPELRGRIHRGEIGCHLSSMPLEITPTHVTLQHADGRTREVAADFVLLLTGYRADMSLFRAAGAELDPVSEAPLFDEQTMETTVPGLFAAGTAVAGTQDRFSLFIENCHIHAQRIAAALAGEPPPPAPPPLTVPES